MNEENAEASIELVDLTGPSNAKPWATLKVVHVTAHTDQ